MKAILEKYVGSEIGINIERPLVVESVRLTAVCDGHFSVHREKDGNIYHIPFTNIVKACENAEGVVISSLFKHTQTYSLVVKIGHVVAYLPA